MGLTLGLLLVLPGPACGGPGGRDDLGREAGREGVVREPPDREGDAAGGGGLRGAVSRHCQRPRGRVDREAAHGAVVRLQAHGLPNRRRGPPCAFRVRVVREF